MTASWLDLAPVLLVLVPVVAWAGLRGGRS